MRHDLPISHKVNRVLNLTLLAFLLIFIRVWYLGVIQHEEHVEKALKPQRKTLLDKVERATIRDRFNIPLATNKMQYNAAVRYADLRQIPSGVWRKDNKGNKYREPLRSNYILKLSSMLADVLHMDPVEIEDTIHAKASLFPHTPFVIKEDLSEEEYFHLKMLEKDWIGMEAQKGSRRIYPMGMVGCDTIGYLGAISDKQYVRLAEEIKTLQDYVTKRDRGELAVLPKGFSDPIEARKRLQQLKEKAYTINDYVGKAGIESVYEETLRGLHGRQIFEVDPKGNPIRLMASSKKGTSGDRLHLTLSSELQEYAEGLLAHNEEVRQRRDMGRMIGVARPWILGGAIVAMEPSTGDVLALASYPRFDPNDFIPSQRSDVKKEKQNAVQKWLEAESFVAAVWDGVRPMERERYDLNKNTFYTETRPLSWTSFLDTVLPPDSSITKGLQALFIAGSAHEVVAAVEALMQMAETKDARCIIQVLYNDPKYTGVKKTISQDELDLTAAKLLDHKDKLQVIKKFLDRYLCDIKCNDDKVLLLDLCRLILPEMEGSTRLPSQWKNYPLAKMHELRQVMSQVKVALQEEIQPLHHELDFSRWRKEHFKDFLKTKRQEEKDQKKYVRPYTEYLEKVEKALFKEFWNALHPLLIYSLISDKVDSEIAMRPQLRAYAEKLKKIKTENPKLQSLTLQLEAAFSNMAPDDALSIIKGMKGFADLSSPLWGRYRMLRNTAGEQQLKHLAASFYPLSGYGYGRSQAYRQAAAQGSVFKLVVAYEAMREKYHYLLENSKYINDINPLTLIDQLRSERAGTNQQILGYTLDGHSIPRYYKGGRLPRSHPNIGTIDVAGALEQSSNLYFSFLAQEHIEDPQRLEEAAKNMGYGMKTGIELPGEIPGHIPKDLSDNKTGLYSFAIGQHSLVVTPLQTSVMTSCIANGGKVFKPKIVQLQVGEKATEELFSSRGAPYPFQEQLSLAGIYFPLFTEALEKDKKNEIVWQDSEVIREIFLPHEIRSMLLHGMQKVINGPKGTARPGVIRALYNHPKIYKDYMDMRYRLVGKTGTAETLYKQWIDAESTAEISNNIWFSGISFAVDEEGKTLWDKPEIVVSVYLRFSDTGGKEAAPLAAQIAVKWKELCEKYGKTSYIVPMQ